MSKSSALILFAFAALALLGAFWLGQKLSGQYDAADIAAARRAAGDSATAAVSGKYLRELVGPLRDSVRFYKAKPQAGAVVVVRHDTLHHTDTVTVADTVSPRHTIVWPVYTASGASVVETTYVAPPSYIRGIHITLQPDSVVVALLRLPDGSNRFSAIVKGYGYAQVTDAAITPPKGRKIRFGCAAGPAVSATTDGTVRAGIGVACGLAY